MRGPVHWYGGRAAIGLTQHALEVIVFAVIGLLLAVAVFRQEILSILRWMVCS